MEVYLVASKIGTFDVCILVQHQERAKRILARVSLSESSPESRVVAYPRGIGGLRITVIQSHLVYFLFFHDPSRGK